MARFSRSRRIKRNRMNLNERRQRSKSMMGLDLESLQNSLAVNGYHGLGKPIYDDRFFLES
jgi:hypothetical protein